MLGQPEDVKGVGLGLRREIFDELLARRPAGIDFLEVSPENFMRRGGAYPAALGDAAASYPIVTHGLSMSLGGTDALDEGYLREVRAFVHDVGSPWHSDHLCFGASGGRILHDLLPIAFKEDAVRRVADRIRRARDALGVPVAIENITYYMHPGKKDMEEPEFLTRVCDAADCGLLLDVNNAYVNATNFGFDVDAWMREAPLERVVQIHVAGHETFDLEGERIVVDTHGAQVADPVLALLARVLERTGDVPILLERDNNVPALDELVREVDALRRVRDRALGAA